jgi:catechol 2,3-dioxygenase-like lactoylglutathione lyase family enzyme
MIDHVSIAVADLTRAIPFYEALLAALGHTRLRVSDTAAGFGKTYPEFWLNLRESGSASASTGAHVALRAGSVAAVEAFHKAALANGGACDGPPGFREIYDPRYYAAFIRDPDGNRIEAVTLVEENAQT